MKIPKGYRKSTQGYPDKETALFFAKKQRDIGYRARVIRDGKWWRILWAQPEDLPKKRKAKKKR